MEDIGYDTYLEIEMFARNIHKGQAYGKYCYYYGHLHVVAGKFEELFDEPPYLRSQSACLLHDVLEDTACTYEQLVALAGKDIADHVVILSKREGDSRKDYLQRVKQNDLCCTVKIADALCNMEACLAEGNLSRAKYYADTLSVLLE